MDAILTTHSPARATDKVQQAKLRPKEHGAYAILAIPLACALWVSGISIVGVCVAVAAVAGFLAHEPLLVAWGHRGTRARRATPAAPKRLALLLGLTIVCGSTAVVAGTTATRLALVGCVAMAATGFAIAITGKHRTLAGQSWGILGLSMPCLPILLSGPCAPSQAFAFWAMWLLGFTATTFAVHSVIAAQKRRPRGAYAVILASVSLLTIAGVWLQISYLAAVIPMLIASWFLFLRPPAARYLKQVGWALVSVTVATAILLIL